MRDSVSEYTEIVLPNDANPLGNLLGGRLMHLVDLAGATTAMRHARRAVVTASVDSMIFVHPVHIGQLVILKASVNRVFRTSLEAGVRVMVEDLLTGETKHVSSAYVTFVALDQQGNRVLIPPVIPETASEIRRFEAAEKRRQLRLALREATAK